MLPLAARGDVGPPFRIMMRKTETPNDSSRVFIAGSENGQSTLVWYVDYTFKYTAVARGIIRSVAQELYEDQSVLAFRQAHGATQSDQRDLTARAAVAAGWQDSYLDMHSALLEQSGKIDEQDIERISREIGLDIDRFRADLWSEETWHRIAQDRADGVLAGLKDQMVAFIKVPGTRRRLRCRPKPGSTKA